MSEIAFKPVSGMSCHSDVRWLEEGEGEEKPSPCLTTPGINKAQDLLLRSLEGLLGGWGASTWTASLQRCLPPLLGMGVPLELLVGVEVSLSQERHSSSEMGPWSQAAGTPSLSRSAVWEQAGLFAQKRVSLLYL